MSKDKSLISIQGSLSPSEKTLDYGTNPVHFGRMTRPDGYAQVTGSCGATDEIFLRIREGKIKDAKFFTDGSLFSKAACNAAAHLAIGKALHQCLRIDQDSILEHLEGIPYSHIHCALLAATTLFTAVKNYVLDGTK